MPAKTLLAILFLASVAIAAVIVIRALPHEPTREAAAAAPAREILVAAVPLPAGTLLRPEDVRWWAPPADASYPGEITRPELAKREAKPESDEEARAEVRGAALRRNLEVGAPVVRGNLVKPGDRDFLRVVLISGSRAVSLPLPSGTAFLSPGDRVDVILTQSFRDTPVSRRSVSETIAEDLRVLAVEGSNNAPRTVTLEVASEQAEKINVANELGKMTLALRGGSGRIANAPGIKPVWAGDVSPALNGSTVPAPPVPTEPHAVQVLHGTKNTETVKTE